MLKWALTAGHLATLWELYLLVMALSWATFLLTLLWLVYVAIEPMIRRNWPDALISWTRLHTGRLRDRLVASHILAGLVAGLIFRMLYIALWSAGNTFSGVQRLQLTPDIESLNLDSVRYLFGCLFRALEWGAFSTAGFIFLVVLSRSLIRRVWLADLVVTLPIVTSLAGERIEIWLVFAPVLSSGSLWLLRRFGLLALVVSQLAWLVIQSLPVSVISWYANYSLITLSIMAVIGAWALSATLTQRSRYALSRSSTAHELER